MKSILCYGDLNTWGYIPGTGERYPHDVRWTGVLKQTLGVGYHVIEEGLNGRTTVWDDPLMDGRNGKEYLTPCLASHAPLDSVIILLGTNDLKGRFSASVFDVASGIGLLVDIIRRSEEGRVKRSLLRFSLRASLPLFAGRQRAAEISILRSWRRGYYRPDGIISARMVPTPPRGLS